MLVNTSLLVIGTWAISLPIGALLGAAIAKLDIPGRRLLLLFSVSMLLVPLQVYAAAWHATLGAGGWVTTLLAGESSPIDSSWFSGWPAAIWIHAAAAMPWITLLTAASLATVDRTWEEQSVLDAAGWKVVCRVSLQRGSSGIIAGAVWTALIIATEIAVTDLFQIRTFAEEIYVEASLGNLAGTEAALGSDFLIGLGMIATAAFAAAAWLAPWWPAAAAASLDATWAWRPRRGRWAWSTAIVALVAAWYAAPVACLAWKAGQISGGGSYRFSAVNAVQLVFRSPWMFRRELGWSLITGVAAALIVTALALCLAWLVRTRPAMKWPMLIGVALIAAVPGPLLAIAVIRWMNPSSGPLREVLAGIYDHTLTAPIVVQALRALPLAALFLWSQIATIPQSLIDAARLGGASGQRQLFSLAMPMRGRAIVCCLVASLLIAMGELPGSLLVSPPGATLLSVRIFGLLHYGADDQVAALSLAIIGGLFALAALALAIRSACRRGERDSVES